MSVIANATRRDFIVKGAAASLMATACTTVATAQADEAGTAFGAIVVGGGISGISAGLRMIELGVENVLIVTKADSLGSGCNSRVAGGQFLYPMEDTDEGVQLMIESFNKKSQGKGREDLTELVCSRSKAANEWLISHGCEFTDAVQVQPYDVLAVNAAPGGGKGMPILMDQMAEEFLAAGSQELCNAKLLDIVLDDMGAVCGVKVRGEEGVKVLSSANVVIATGGYLANKAVMEASCGADGDEILVRGVKSLTGDGLLAVERAGGMRYCMGGIEQSMHIAPVPPQMPALCPFSSAMYTMVVNKNGERFVDESLGYVAIGKAAYNQPGQTHALVFDSAMVADIAVMANDLAKFESFGIPVAQADTIEELAEQIGVDPAVFAATVEGFNAAIEGEATNGLAIEKTACACKIETDPFYAFYPMVPGGTQCFGGIYTDGDCRALEADGTVIEGLFVAGEALGGLFAYDYIGGGSLTRCVVSGMRIAEVVAGA